MRSFFKVFPGIALVVMIVASAPPAHAAYAFAPLAVVAGHASTDDGSVAFVAWSRGSEAADEYRVYGVNGTNFELLQVETGTGTRVPAGYSAYAVTGVLLGVESDPVYALIVPCVHVNLFPPGYAIGDCFSGIGIES